MKEAEQKSTSNNERKEKIRRRYRGIAEDQLSVIPAVPKLDIFDRDRKLRVAIYARVSTGDPNQTSSYELQKNHYTDLANRNPNWELVDIYADEGISGTSLNHRVNFIRMINDCEAGRVDLIVTKSVSRFARNILDGVGYVRKLADMTPPVGVFFETENINTFKSESEMPLSMVSVIAQEESHTKSEVMNSSIEMRFSRGIFLTPALLGYDQDEDGNLVINEEEAKTVRLIFFMYIYGYSCTQIANTLTKLGRKTKKGNTSWSGSTVMAQLKNERHCGSVLARKTFTPNYLDHKSRKNRKDRNQYFQAEHHEPIISPKDFIYVQHMIQYTKSGNVSVLPVLHAVPDGILAGFVTINPRWTGFSPLDYLNACTNATDISDKTDDNYQVTVEKGDLDFRGYEIARIQFFDIANRLALTVSPNKMNFSTSCLRIIDGAYVEILIHPIKRIIAVRKTSADNRLAFKWSRMKYDDCIPRHIGISAISSCIFTLSGWDTANNYRVYGTQIENGDSSLILFNTEEAEIYIPEDAGDESLDKASDENIITSGTTKRLRAYPASWAGSFGGDYYTQRYMFESAIQKDVPPVISTSDPMIYNPHPDLQIPNPDMIASQINDVMKAIIPEEA